MRPRKVRCLLEKYYHRKYRNPSQLYIAPGCFILCFFLIFVLLVCNSCAQTIPPGALDWDYSLVQCDTVQVGTPNEYVWCDTLNADSTGFTVYYSSLRDTLYSVLGEVRWPATIYYTVEEKWLYSNVTWYFYCTAWEEFYSNYHGAIRRRTSIPSDTVSALFPVLDPDRPQEFKIIKFSF